MDSPFRFVGTSHVYRNRRRVYRWGAFYIENEARSGRKRPLHPGDCPFCEMAAEENSSELVGQLSAFDEHYLIATNNNPIV